MEQIGEVVLVNFPLVIAEGKRGKIPQLGSIVKTDSNLLGIVVSHSIESKIPGRTPVAYGKSTVELEKEQPQVFDLMRWLFQVVFFGKVRNGAPEISLPEKSVEIHSLIFATDEEVTKKLLEERAFLNFIFGSDVGLFPQRNEIVLCLLREYFANLPDENKKAKYVKIFSNLAKILKNDYSSLKKLMDGVKI